MTEALGRKNVKRKGPAETKMETRAATEGGSGPFSARKRPLGERGQQLRVWGSCGGGHMFSLGKTLRGNLRKRLKRRIFAWS